MNKIEQLKDLILSKGIYDEREKMSILPFEHEIEAPCGTKNYITLLLEDSGKLLAGIDISGYLFVEDLEPADTEFLADILCKQ